jgi:D-alanyl-D-alanine carboxypeptidase
LEGKLFAILDSAVDGKNIFGSVVRVQSGDRKLDFTLAAGKMHPDQRYFIASTTKLYTTAVIMRMRVDGLLNLSDPIGSILDAETMSNLHLYHGTDYSQSISIEHLLAQTSGLPNYFGQKPEGHASVEMDLIHGIDRSWTYGEAIALSKQLRPKFAPGTRRKAFYSDTNYQLLGMIIEKVSGKSLHDAYSDMIMHPMGLTSTYLYRDPEDLSPIDIYHKDKQIHVPNAMTSVRSDGGIVSTADESMQFLRAFFRGSLFPAEYLPEMQQWRRIFWPLQYGTGMAKFQLPRIFSPFKPMPAFIGHSGLSGAFAFYVPSHDIYLTGTVNQIHKPGTSFRLLLKLVSKIGSERR